MVFMCKTFGENMALNFTPAPYHTCLRRDGAKISYTKRYYVGFSLLSLSLHQCTTKTTTTHRGIISSKTTTVIWG